MQTLLCKEHSLYVNAPSFFSWFVCLLTAAKGHCLLMKAAFENLQLKTDFYQAILQSKNVQLLANTTA